SGPLGARPRRLDDLAGLDARGADVQAGRGAAEDGPAPLDVRVPAPLGAPVRVRDAHPPGRALPAELTDCCHGPMPSVPTSWPFLARWSSPASDVTSASRGPFP